MLVIKGIRIDGEKVSIDTLCLHGDNELAVENAWAVRKVLSSEGINISPLCGT
jgi:lactam utilization protein B